MRSDAARLLDMLLSARAILSYTEGVSAETFMNTRILQSAVTRELEIIGEAARALSDETRTRIPQLPWAKIMGMRNRIIHEYFDVRLDIVWDVVQDDIPVLIAHLEAVVPPDIPDEDLDKTDET